MKFRDCVQTAQAKISGLFSGSSGLVLIPKLISLGFVVYFGILIIR